MGIREIPLRGRRQASPLQKRVKLVMAVTKIGEKYYCAVCGNEVTVTKVGGGTLVCCGQAMILK